MARAEIFFRPYFIMEADMAKQYNLDMRPGESKGAYYKRLAKVADQRMVRLEQLAKEGGQYTNILKYSYAKAVHNIDIYHRGKGKNPRWNTKPPEESQLMNEKIMAMQDFIRSTSSTKGGIKSTYQKRADTLNQRFGTNMTWQEVADYFTKGIADKLSRDYGSATALYAIGVIQKRSSEILKGIKTNKSITMDGPVTDAALEIIRKTKYAPESLIRMDKNTKKKIRKELESL